MAPFVGGTFLFYFIAVVTVGDSRLTITTMVVQVGLLITVHGERCTAF